ncbi:MAG: hypothetical protein ACREIT_08205, partial [Tepidisphaeraceae bacterium]
MDAPRTPDNTVSARLLISRSAAKEVVRALLEEGTEIQNFPITSNEELERQRVRKADWNRQVTAELQRLFDRPVFADEFNNWVGKMLSEDDGLGPFVEQFNAEMAHRTHRLKRLMRRMDKSSSDSRHGMKASSGASSGSNGSSPGQT